MGTSSSEIAVPVVLSSGQPLATLPALTSTTVQQLKSSLVGELTRQVQTYQLQPGPHPALQFRHSPNEEVTVTFAYVSTHLMPLFLYGGQKLEDSCRLDSVRGQVCALRPSDIVTTSYDTRGQATVTVFNLEEPIVWKVRQESCVIDLAVYSALSDVFLLAVNVKDTVLQVKKRIASVLSGLSASGSLWHKSTALGNEQTVMECGLGTGSRVLLQQPGEAVGLVRDREGREVAVPVCEGFVGLRIARILESEWGLCDSFCEYVCISPPHSAHFSKFYLIGSSTDRFLKLQTAQGSTKVVVPAECSVLQLHRHIEAQHSLPASLLCLTAISELAETGRIGDYDVSNGEELLLFTRPAGESTVKIKVISKKYGKVRFSLPLSTSISHIKALIRAKKPQMPPECALLLASTVLEDSKTLTQYGVFENVALHCGSREEMLRKASQVLSIRLLPVSKAPKPTRSQDPLELFDRQRSAEWQSPSARRQVYDLHLQTAIPIRLLAPKSVLSIHIRPDSTPQTLKTSLQSILKIQEFSLIWNNTVLIEDKTLVEQGVKAGDLLSIDSQSTLHLTMVSCGGERLPVLVEKNAELRVLKRLIGEMASIPVNLQRIVVTKSLKSSDLPLFAGISSVYVSLKLGRGSAFSLRLPSQVTVRVAADRQASASEVQAQLRRYGLTGLADRETSCM